ncbi:FkbM family methyltransferase [Methylobacterium sp. PvR107]|nr:FkbM family methyltransferase [Methylobacterium sp. PvR107]
MARNPNPRIHLTQKALGQTIGKAIFHQSSGHDLGGGAIDQETGQVEEWDQSGSLREPKEHLEKFPWVKFDRTIEVDVTTLDAWAAENYVKYVDFIWADVQGAEEDLILGGMNTLRNTRYFYTEFSTTELYAGAFGLNEITERLPFFEIVEVFQQDVLLRNKNPWG